MACADLREELTCSVCLSIYTDPVTLICGHNFCLGCINRTWDHQDEGEYSCPECLHRFRRRPELNRNLRLRNIAETFQPTEPVDKTGILCTNCTQPAAKSCLLCEASLCDTHLRSHSKSEEHVLTEPTTSWGNRKHTKYKELLKYYCTEDAACICVSCSLAGEHRGHQVELLNEASERKKKWRDVLQNLTTKREKTEKRVQSLQEYRSGMGEKAAGVAEQHTALIMDIRKQLEDLEKRVLSEITRQQEQVLLTVSNQIQQLEKEKDELTRKMSHIEDLCNMTDPLTVLQEQESHRDDFCGAEKGDNEVTQRGDTQVTVQDLDEDLMSVTLYTGLADIVTDVKRKIYMQVTSDILLDINTANNNVIVSDDLKSVSFSRINHQRTDTPERFTYFPQVLSSTTFSSGRHYWEVETSELGHYRIGMWSSSLRRKGDESAIGDNNKSWCLYKWATRILSVVHDSVRTDLLHRLSCDRLGILLDYEAGRLSFYELCVPIRHLYTFTATFTEPLHAAFYVYKEAWVRIKS
ncbi:E3 ubiquitin/ISG15 ligase TRIM25-like [Bombina bombina]|uniref:E3 ubiquitin/ISG15 ligase TRIM25-like n=1 Tax=Bombina bombina TaxID=8345 RepID=UPI00235ACA61|nr:E3 ubiquitin/ISG15 ligase TRIM25-like [Bombina bombina]